MSSVTVASHAAPSFLANLLKEHSITDVNFVPDNAKAPATVPRSVYCQSPKSGREIKSISRWDSIVRTESQETRENNRWNGRRGSRRRSGEVHSLSPSPLNRVVERRNELPLNDSEPDENLFEKFNSSAPCLNYRGSSGSSNLPDVQQESRENNRWHGGSSNRRQSDDVHSLSPSPLNRVVGRRNELPLNDCKPDENIFEKFNSSAPSLNYRGPSGSSNLPDVLRDNLVELVASDDNIRTPQDRIRHVQGLVGPLPPPMRQKSDESILGNSSTSTSRKPERRGSLDIERIERPDPLRQRSSSDPALSVPQRRAFIESNGESAPSKRRRARRRASMDSVPSRKKRSPKKTPKVNVSSWWNLKGDKNDGDSDGNGTTSTHELTPSPSTPLVPAAQTFTVSNNSIEAPPLNATPPPRRAARRSSMPLKMPSSRKKSNRPKSPPHQQPGTPPSVERKQRSSKKKKNKKRSTSPPPPQPGTPPSLKRDHRSRRHSDSIISIDMEVSEELLHLAQISLPVMPVRQLSLGSGCGSSSEDGKNAAKKAAKNAAKNAAKKTPETVEEDFASDVRDDQGERILDEARQYIEGKADSTSEEVEAKPMEKEDTETSPRKHKVHFALQACYSPPKKSLPNRVTFSPRRMHSAPIAGQDPRKEDDETVLSSFRRRKPFTPGQKSSIVATKTGMLTRTRTNSARDDGRNRDIIKASLREHSSKGECVLDGNDSSSSIELMDIKSILDLFPEAPSLDTPPRAKKKKKKSRRSSLPLAPNLEESPTQITKKKRSRRRSLY